MTSAEAGGRALAIRLWLGCLATQELMTIYLGIRLGLYECLLREGPATALQLAGRARIGHRYAREWLEQQAVAGIITVTDTSRAADDRVYALPAGHGTVLTGSDNPISVAPMAVLPIGAVAGALPQLLEAYRTGAGVPDTAYGSDWRDGHEAANRALFSRDLPAWIRRWLPDVHARLAAGPSRIADIACGAGWSSIALALSYPGARVDGFDLDPVILGTASKNAASRGLASQVCFEVRDAQAPDAWPAGRDGEGYDLVCVFDALHEMPRPVEVLRCCRAILAPGGSVLVMDARVAETFTAPADETERFQYATSVLHCLPVGLTGVSPAGTGTAMRPAMVREYALAAGFAEVEVTGVEERFHRLYRLRG
ncbi:MAG: class I SAM-dependent methyltransferase [Streptosporangiaceae bacterium]